MCIYPTNAGLISVFFQWRQSNRTELITCVLVVFQTLPLVSQSRRLVREGPVTQLLDFSLKDTERNIYLHLFNDYLLISVHKE